jgi:hypothetical protein
MWPTNMRSAMQTSRVIPDLNLNQERTAGRDHVVTGEVSCTIVLSAIAVKLSPVAVESDKDSDGLMQITFIGLS